MSEIESTNGESQELTLLRKIDDNVTGLKDRMDIVERNAIKYGAAAGAGAGAIAGGIVAMGVSFARVKLGL